MNRIIFSLLLISVLYVPIFSQEENEDEIQSLREERREILLYGIDSEVAALITTLNTEEIDEFNDEILEQMENTSNTEIIIASFQLFMTTDYREAERLAIDILENDDLYNNTVLTRAMSYLGDELSKQGAEAVFKLIDHEQASVSRSAVATIGKSDDEDHAEKLLELLEDDDFHEEVKTTILVSLGDMKAETAVEMLTEIVQDTDEEKAWRWYACQALGKIGARSSFDVIKSLLGDNDPHLRSFAVEGIGYYTGRETADILITALRDSFWKVRVSAAKQLGELREEVAVDILKYKAGNDPENNVRKEAIKALGLIGDSEGIEYLRELAGTTKTNPAIWAYTVDILVDNDLENSIEVFTEMIEDEWEKDNSYHLEYIAKALSIGEGNFLSTLAGQFLEHPSMNVKIYGLRMAEKNRFDVYMERMEELSAEENPRAVRQTALSAIESIRNQ